MAKLRKMLGSADSPGVVALMRQMETQSRETLARWSAGYARESLLPICLAAHPQDTLPAQLLALAMDWAKGRCDGKTVRPLLAALRDAVLAAVPGCRIARDQFCRKYDLAIDFCEDAPRLPLSAAEEIRRVCEAQGAHAKISSIHVNAWFGDYDKRSMTELFFREVLREDAVSQSIFFGDSPNDEPMFSAFPLACAVANIAPFAARMAHLPPYVASLPGGAGFAEAAAHILAQKERV